MNWTGLAVAYEHECKLGEAPSLVEMQLRHYPLTWTRQNAEMPRRVGDALHTVHAICTVGDASSFALCLPPHPTGPRSPGRCVGCQGLR